MAIFKRKQKGVLDNREFHHVVITAEGDGRCLSSVNAYQQILRCDKEKGHEGQHCADIVLSWTDKP